jgi:hypothetical protein
MTIGCRCQGKLVYCYICSIKKDCSSTDNPDALQTLVDKILKLKGDSK